MSHQMTRREMIQTTTLAAGSLCTCGLVYAAKSNCCITPDLEPESFIIKDDKIIIDLHKAESLSPGHAVNIINKEKSINIIIVQAGENDYYTLSKTCTHGGHQPVSYVHSRGLLQCNGYNHSLYTLTGEVWKGPAPEPLTSFPTKLKDNTLEITI